MKVLIFGGLGFVGKYLENELVENKHDVYITDIKDIERKNYYKINISNNKEVKHIIEITKPDCIVNLAGISSVSQSWVEPKLTIETNLIGTINILEGVRTINPTCKILLIGSSEEYAPSIEKTSENSTLLGANPYSVSKIAQENIAKIYKENYKLNIVMTRTFNHTGVGQSIQFVIPSFISQVKHKNEVVVGNLDIVRDFGDVRDMVEAYRILIENNNNSFIYNVGSGLCYSLREILEYIISISNKEVKIIEDKSRIRLNDNKKTLCDNSKMFKEYGYKPKYDILNTINEMYSNQNY